MAVLALAGVALLAAIAFPFAPVRADSVSYRWSADGQQAVALPLMPYQPVELTAMLPCAAASSLPDGGVLLSTVPLVTDPAAPVLPGLLVSVLGGSLVVHSQDQLVAQGALSPVSASDCGWTVRSTAERTELLLDGALVGAADRDLRPAVTGLFTEVEPNRMAGLDVRITADTMFQSTISPMKAALAGLFFAALLGALLLVWRLDRRHGRIVPRLAGRRWWRPMPADAVVVAMLGLWAVIGPTTVDDGYIGGMLRSRDANDFVGNVYRWLNAPEAPFGWFYEIMNGLGQLGWSALWLRVPSTLLAIACWVLLSRLLLPRLGRFVSPWLVAVGFAGWWLPFNLGLRSEPWVAVGTLAVVCLVERAIATRRVLPLAVSLVIASATVATAPTGIIAVAPYLAALLPLFRVLRARVDLRWFSLLLLTAAAGSAGFLLMFADQSFVAVVEATRIRRLVADSAAWHQEYQRYASLLTAGSIEGPLQRRMPVLLTLAAMAGLFWLLGHLGRRGIGIGIATGPARRLVLTMALSLALFTAAPTKWTYHFGALAGVGAGVLVLALRAFRTAGVAAASGSIASAAAAAGTASAETPMLRLRVTAIGVLAVTGLGGLALSGYNQWPFVANYGVLWGTIAPLLFGHGLASPVAVAGALGASALLVLAAWLRARGAAEPRWRLPSPAALALLLVMATVLLQLGSFAAVSVQQRGSYTMANDSLRALRGTSCGLADYLQVEPDPTAGELQITSTEGAAFDGFTDEPPHPSRPPLKTAGQPAATHGSHHGARRATASSPWYRLTDAQRRGELPLVVTVSGTLGLRSTLTAEFRAGLDGHVTTIRLMDVPTAPHSRDLRLMAAAGADQVRLVATDGGRPTDVPLAFSVPRAPVLVALNELLPPGTTALLDWPVAFYYPCLRMPALINGAAELPQWRISTPAADERSPLITYAPRSGGPFATARLLVTEQQLPLYLQGDPLADVGRVYRWVPTMAFGQPATEQSTATVPGWHRNTRLALPGR